MKHPLDKMSWGVIPISTYRGCLITKDKDGYIIFGQKVSNPEDVDLLIDGAGEAIAESILKNPPSLTISNTNGSINTIDND